MSRLLPAPLLSIALAVLWLLLNVSMSAGNLLLAVLLGWLAPLLMSPLRPQTVRIRRPMVVLQLLLRVGGGVLVSNLQVFWRVWTMDVRAPRSAFVEIPLQLQNANGLAALAAVATVIPGTVWSELALDRSVLLMHVLDLDDEAQFIEEFKDTYERPLMEIFQ
jgi:multicomponent K+:H+ antiporter subunit E